MILWWSVGSMACRISILQFEQHCGTEATFGFVLRLVATFARFFSCLILTSSSRTCSGTQKFSRIRVLFAVLFPIDPLQNSPFLQRRPALPSSHLDLDCRAMLCCVCLDTMPHWSFEVQHCVRHSLGSDVTEFPLMSCAFTSNYKLADLMTETSTLLVESTASSILNVLHRCLPVPQSNAITLIPASSISSVRTSL